MVMIGLCGWYTENYGNGDSGCDSVLLLLLDINIYNSICYDIMQGFRLRYEIFTEIEITAMIDFGTH